MLHKQQVYFAQLAEKAKISSYRLTKQEQAITKLLIVGKLYKEVASSLYISENTVRAHVRHIYGKLHIHSKAELATKIYNERLL